MQAKKIEQARQILTAVGMPKGQLNDRSALTLLALLALSPRRGWNQAKAPLIGVTPIMDWMNINYGMKYAPNSRETIRRQTLHQFVDAGLALYNPDKPDRSVNSPAAVYQIAPQALKLLVTYGTKAWDAELLHYLGVNGSLAKKYAEPRNFAGRILKLDSGIKIRLSPGMHSQLIHEIVNSFAFRFVGESKVLYVGDTGNKIGFFDDEGFAKLGIALDKKGKLPDVVIQDLSRNWILLIEAVTSHGPVDAKRKRELSKLFEKSALGIVFVTAFPNKKTFNKYLAQVAWETEVWIADNPDHLVHFNGERFLGPY